MSFFSDNSSLYLYSALLQANAAILSLFAIFIIFRIQSYESIINGIRNALYSFSKGGGITGDEISMYETMTAEQRLNFMKNKKFTRSGAENIYAALKDWNRYFERNVFIKKLIILPSVILGSSILFFALEILFSSYIHSMNKVIEKCFMGFSILLEMCCIFLVISRIFRILQIKIGSTPDEK